MKGDGKLTDFFTIQQIKKLFWKISNPVFYFHSRFYKPAPANY